MHWIYGGLELSPRDLLNSFAREARVVGDAIEFGDEYFDLRGIQRIVVVGAGKASGSMATAPVPNVFATIAVTHRSGGLDQCAGGKFRTS